MSLPTPTELGNFAFVEANGTPHTLISFFPSDQDQLNHGDAEGLPAALAAVGGPIVATQRPVIVFMM